MARITGEFGRAMLLDEVEPDVVARFRARAFPGSPGCGFLRRHRGVEAVAVDLQHALTSAGLEGSSLVIEITERTAIKDYPKFRGRLKEFRDQGYRFAVDDAGRGQVVLVEAAKLVWSDLADEACLAAERRDAHLGEQAQRVIEAEIVGR